MFPETESQLQKDHWHLQFLKENSLHFRTHHLTNFATISSVAALAENKQVTD